MKSDIRWWSLGPLFVTVATLQMVHSEATYLGAFGLGGDERAPGRIVGLGAAYLWAAYLCVRARALALSAIASVPFYWLALCFALLSMLWSLYPMQVITDLIHAVGIALVCAAATSAHQHSKAAFLRGFMLLLAMFLVVNLLFMLLVPQHGIHANGRWSGLLYRPNNLGAMALMAVWTASLCMHVAERAVDRLMPAGVLLLAGLCLYGTNSITSIVLSGAVVVTTPVLLGFGRRGRLISVLWVLALGYLVGVVAFALYLFVPEIYSAPWLLAQLGRDESFTGRTEIWALAWEAIQQRPYLGWSYDSLRTLHAGKFAALPAQMHNGYIHLLVLGGTVGAVLGALLVTHVTLRLLRAASRVCFAAGFSGIGIVLLHNVTEASFFRPGHVIWVQFLLIALLLAPHKRARRRADRGRLAEADVPGSRQPSSSAAQGRLSNMRFAR